MSTHAIIARETAPGKFIGRYHHSDGYPTHLGDTLYKLFNGFFAGNMQAMTEFLIDQHPAGWSFISADQQDFSLPAGYRDGSELYEKNPDGSRNYDKMIPHGPRCYCHGERQDEAGTLTEADAAEYAWAYILSGVSRMTVLMRGQQVAVVDLDKPAPKWDRVECGENLEHCGHYAWYHFPELEGTSMNRLGTEKFLGREELGPDDAIAYEIKGIRCQRRGSGSLVHSTKDGSDLWAETLKAPEGVSPHSFDGAYRFNFRYSGDKRFYDDGTFWHPVMRYNAKHQRVLVRGVKAIYPPTLKDPIAVFAELRSKLAKPGETTAKAPSEDMLSFVGRKFRND